MLNRKPSLVSSVLLGLLIPMMAVFILILPMQANAEYPSSFGDRDMSSEMKSTQENLEKLAERYPYLVSDEDGKPLTPEFVKYDLAGLDLSDTDLRGATFSVSTLKNSNLRGANLEDSIAYATRFDNADLSDTNLRNANLRKSIFDGAKIEGADFTDALLDNNEKLALCERATGNNSKTGADTFESLDCIGLTERSVK